MNAIILLSKINIYPSNLERIYKNKKISNLTFLDVALINNAFDKSQLEREFFHNRNLNQYVGINDELEKISKKLNITFLKKQDFLCDEIKKICDLLTENKEKIFFDYGHFTLDGAKHFGYKIYKLNWLIIK